MSPPPEVKLVASNRHRRYEQGPRPYHVIIAAGAKRGRWGSFADLAAATSVIERLRRHGMNAILETDEGTL